MSTMGQKNKEFAQKMRIPKHNEKLIITKKFTSVMNKIETLARMNVPCLLLGHAGIGKNQAVSEVACKLNKPIIKVNCSGDMRTSSLLGRMAPDADGKFAWEDGLITKAIKEGTWLVLDEINSLDPDILFSIHGLIDDGYISIANNSEIVEAHPDFRLFATMNPISYFGVKTPNQALLDRFAVIEMGFDDDIDEILIDRLDMQDNVKKAMKNIIKNLREIYDNDQTTQNFGHRTLSNIVDFSKEFGLMDAIDMSYTNKLPDTQRAAVKSLLRDLMVIVPEHKPRC